MLDIIAFAIFFFLPAGIANSIPVVAAKIHVLDFLDIPIDAGQKIGGIRIFGDHKTVRGFLTGTLAAIGTSYLLQIIFTQSSHLQAISPIDYSLLNPIILGSLLGFGALFGDAVKSFFKRRVGVKPGQSWFIFDQLDYIIGGLLFSSLYIQLDWLMYLSIIIVWFALHLLFTFIAYLAGLKSDPI